MKKQKVLIICRGCPGSGKSFLARRLAGRKGGKIFSADMLVMNRDGYAWCQELCYRSHQICQQLVELAMKRGEKCVILDNTNLLPRHARPYVDLARKHGYSIEVREPETEWKHDLEILLLHGVHNVPKETVEDMLTTWKNVPLSQFKKVLELDNDERKGFGLEPDVSPAE